MYDETITACFQLQREELVSTSSFQGCRESDEGETSVSVQRSYQETASHHQVAPHLKSQRCFELRGCALHSRERDGRPRFPPHLVCSGSYKMDGIFVHAI